LALAGAVETTVDAGLKTPEALPPAFWRSPRVPMFSPDGQWLAYVSDESGLDEVYVRLANGEGRQAISTGGDQAFGAVTVDMGATFTVGSSKVLFEGPYALDPGGYGTTPGNNDVHPDGERFLMTKPMEST
tara:strand:- start:4 stop:396 length:393 start_codon:yes stop_codon:yes gene_type:complete